MNFEIKHLNSIAVFTLKEKRLDANISGLVKSEFTDVVKNQKSRRLIIDLSEVETCDSSGLSSLLVANRLMQSTDGKLHIVTQSKKILSLIKITKLDRVLFLNDTLDLAISEIEKE